MKKIVILFLTIVCSLLLQAQTYIWKDGKIVYSNTAGEIRFNKVPARNFQTVANVVELNNSLYHLLGDQNSYRTRLAGGWHGYNTDIERHTGNYEYSLYTITTTCADLSAANKDPWTYLSKLVYNASIIIEVIASILLSLINTAFVVTITWLLKVIYYCQKCVIHTLNYNNNTNQEEDVIVVTICNRTML